MPNQVEIVVHVPSELGLTPAQIALLKKKLTVELVTTTALTTKTSHKVVVHCVDNNNIDR